MTCQFVSARRFFWNTAICAVITLLPCDSSSSHCESVPQPRHGPFHSFKGILWRLPRLCRLFPRVRGGDGGAEDPVQTASMLARLNDVFDKQLPKRFKLGTILGHGAFSVVRAAVDSETGEEVAVKAVLIPKTVNQPGYAELQDVYRIEAEVKILNMADHPHIIKLLHFFPSPEGSVLVLERCRGGELFNWMQNLEVQHDGTRRWSQHTISETFVARIIGQLLSAVAYLHERKIVHRDLKLENILLKETYSPEKDMVLKIIDVGFGKMLGNDDDKMYSSCGSTYYVAPEVLQADRAAGRGYGKAVDVWSIGVISFILLCTEPPFNGADDAAVISAVRKGEWRIPVHAGLSSEASDFLHRTMTVDASQRPTAHECLAHPWIKHALGHTTSTPPQPHPVAAAPPPPTPISPPLEPPLVAAASAPRGPALHRCSSSTRSGFWLG